MSEEAQLLYFGALKKHRQKDYDGAIQDLCKAVEMDPGLADAWEALGVIYDKTDRLDEAIEATKKLVELQPDEVMGHTNLSRFYMKKGWTEKAEEEQGKARLLGWKKDLASGNTGGDEFTQAEPAGGAPAGPPQIATFLQPGAAPPAPPAEDPAMVQRKIEQFEKLAAANPTDVHEPPDPRQVVPEERPRRRRREIPRRTARHPARLLGGLSGLGRSLRETRQTRPGDPHLPEGHRTGRSERRPASRNIMQDRLTKLTATPE